MFSNDKSKWSLTGLCDSLPQFGYIFAHAIKTKTKYALVYKLTTLVHLTLEHKVNTICIRTFLVVVTPIFNLFLFFCVFVRCGFWDFFAVTFTIKAARTIVIVVSEVLEATILTYFDVTDRVVISPTIWAYGKRIKYLITNISVMSYMDISNFLNTESTSNFWYVYFR